MRREVTNDDDDLTVSYDICGRRSCCHAGGGDCGVGAVWTKGALLGAGNGGCHGWYGVVCAWGQGEPLALGSGQAKAVGLMRGGYNRWILIFTVVFEVCS